MARASERAPEVQHNYYLDFQVSSPNLTRARALGIPSRYQEPRHHWRGSVCR
jgi:hypothetical protein